MLIEVGDGFTAEQCSKKWKTLWDRFVRELRKKKQLRNGDQGTPFLSSWPLFHSKDLLQTLSDIDREFCR